jgi:hypothetical protein
MFRGPLFIIGAPRSGTKLLLKLVGQHPRAAMPGGETEFLPYVARRWSRFGDLSDRERFRAFATWMRGFIYFRDRARHGRKVIDPDVWYETCREYTPAGVFEALARHDSDVPYDSDRIWGDKSPTYMRSVDLLHELFPEGRFLHIIRDGRDVALSTWNTWGRSMLRAAQRWVDDVELCRAQARGLSGAYLEIRFEDLLDDTEAVMRGVCDFIEVPFDPATTAPVRPTEFVGSAKGQARIVKTARRRWVTEMPAGTRRRIESLAGPLLEELGYPLPEGRTGHKRLSRAQMLALQALDGARIWGGRLRSWGVRDVIRYGYRTYIAPR